MKYALAFIFTFCFLGTVVCWAQTDDQEEIQTLGQTFVDSLKENNLVAFAQCWISVYDTQKLYHKMLESKTVQQRKQMIQELRADYLKRDRLITQRFQQIRKAIQNKVGEIKQIKIISVDTHIREKKGIKYTSRFELEFQVNDFLVVTIQIDDGIFLNDRWYFQDKPASSMRFKQHGEFQQILLDEFN